LTNNKKFKVGDRIKLSSKVTTNSPFYEAPPGTTGTIKEDYMAPLYGVKLDDGMPGTALSGYSDYELEALEDG
jgi:hypothetical protein